VVSKGLEDVVGEVDGGAGFGHGDHDGHWGDGVECFGGHVGESGGIVEGCDGADGDGRGGGGCAGVVLDAAADGYIFEGEGWVGEFGWV